MFGVTSLPIHFACRLSTTSKNVSKNLSRFPDGAANILCMYAFEAYGPE